ncbi:MAG: site-specific DNA-methyltransferase [Smithella sp.]|nr:site-specific DNA-methyltransferase [Smithella sp.]
MTELIWEGKYKEDKKVTPVRIALPFQTIETINESAQQRQKTLDFLVSEPDATYGKEWRNRLIWGDKKYVLPSLLPEFAGKVNIIYIDPPFETGANFSYTAAVPDHPDTDEDDSFQFEKQPSIIEQKAYRDTWGKGIESYAHWFYETALLLKELLSNEGCIYVHLDWHVMHYAKAIMDEVFGYENFINEIIWKRGNHKKAEKKYSINHDTILFYSKSNSYKFKPQFTAYEEEYLNKYYPYKDKDGRRYQVQGMYGKGSGPALYFGNKLISPPPGLHWRWKQDKINQAMKDGIIVFPRDGEGMPRFKDYLDTKSGVPVRTIWDDIYEVNSQAIERVDYPTQKPESLLERILTVSSSEGDLALDCFGGSGTTAAVSEKLNRRWITCDLGRFAIHTTRKRLLGIENIKPFVVQNLGKYERQQWMIAEFDKPENRLQQEKSYKHFIIDLYHAKPLDGYTWLHGAKAGRMVHVGNVEAPVTVDDIKSTILEFWKLTGKEKSAQVNGIDFLGWDFAFDVNETAKQFAAENKVNVSFKKIPREVLEKKAVEQGDIKFYELASLSVKTKNEKKKISITLDNFIIPPDDVPNEVQGKITHWSQWVDYWAIDWNYRDDTFHNEWQSYRTKKNPKIELTATNKYEESGKYTVLVKVIDILGNDTTKAIQITV